jgi:hypothetical protein
LGIKKKTMFQDTPENRLEIRYQFNRAMLKEILDESYPSDDLSKLTKDEYNGLSGEHYRIQIDSNEENAESCFIRIFRFLMEQLGKVSHENGESFVDDKNMPRNFTPDELAFFKIGLDELALFFQEVVSECNFSNEEDDNWDLDMINITGKVMAYHGIKFDPNVTVNDVVTQLYK